MAGLTEGSARTIWGILRKKILASQDAVDGALKTPGSGAKKTPAKRKSTGGQKVESGEDMDGIKDEIATATPSKKPRGRPAKKTQTSPKTPDAEVDNDNATEAPATQQAKAKVTPKATPKEKASSKTLKSPQEGSNDTAYEEGATVTVENAEDTIEVDTNGNTEATLIKAEEAIAS